MSMSGPRIAPSAPKVSAPKASAPRAAAPTSLAKAAAKPKVAAAQSPSMAKPRVAAPAAKAPAVKAKAGDPPPAYRPSFANARMAVKSAGPRPGGPSGNAGVAMRAQASLVGNYAALGGGVSVKYRSPRPSAPKLAPKPSAPKPAAPQPMAPKVAATTMKTSAAPAPAMRPHPKPNQPTAADLAKKKAMARLGPTARPKM